MCDPKSIRKKSPFQGGHRKKVPFSIFRLKLFWPLEKQAFPFPSGYLENVSQPRQHILQVYLTGVTYRAFIGIQATPSHNIRSFIQLT